MKAKDATAEKSGDKKTADKKAIEKPAEPTRPNKFLAFATGPGRWIIPCVVLIVGAGIAWRVVWQQVGSHVLADPQYQLTAERLRVSNLPEWIRSDIKAEVLRNASLDASLSLLDDELTVRLAHAFALSPWVQKVVSVSKSGGGVDVQVEFRRPVAMVQVPDGVFPIDRHAVLLPNEDFTADDVMKYPRITDVASEPTAPVGAVWKDARLIGAAALAETLLEHWEPLKLQRISVLSPSAADDPGRSTGYTVYTQSGTQIRWGRSPAEKPLNEMAPQDKFTTLLQFHQEHGSLEGSDGRQIIDLQSGPTLRVVQRSQIVPLPKEEGSE